MKKLFAAIAVCCVFHFAAQLNGQTPTPTPLPQDQPNGTTTYANGLVTTFTPGQSITVATEDGRFSVSIPLTRAFRFLDKHGLSIDPATIKAGARVQAILDDAAPSPVISRLMVDQD